MSTEAIKCVLLADRHHGLSEGIRGLLESEFEAVVMVADETSLIESAVKMRPSIVVADLALAQGENFGWLRRLLARWPGARVIVLSAHDESSVMQSAYEAGAAGFVLKRKIASHLLPAVEAVLTGKPYPEPDGASPRGWTADSVIEDVEQKPESLKERNTKMKTSRKHLSLAALLALAVLPAPPALADDATEQAAAVKEKIQSLRNDCAQGRQQITVTVEALSRLMAKNVELRPEFDRYKAELVKME
jgi:DNA-binding NarL/FixJ family response regulator